MNNFDVTAKQIIVVVFFICAFVATLSTIAKLNSQELTFDQESLSETVRLNTK